MKKITIIFLFVFMLTLSSCGQGEHVHDFKETWISDSVNHWKECSCGEKTEVVAHTPGLDATENDPQVCTICNYVLKEALGHTHAFKETNQLTEAVLGKDGEQLLRCDCGEEKKEPTHYYQWFECVNCSHKNPLRDEIKDSFYDKFNEKHLTEQKYELIRQYIDLYYYYGEYKGCHIVNILYAGLHYEREWLVENETLEYDTLKELSAYYNGEFYSLKKALELNLITKDDIEEIIEVDKLYYPYKYHQFTEDELAYIKEVLGHKINDNWYLGEYNGAYILNSFSGASTASIETINNVVILNAQGDGCKVVYNGKVYTLKEAYINLILTEEDIEKISFCFIKYDFDSSKYRETDNKEPIKLEEKIKSDITLNNITTSLVVTIDKNFQLILTEEHFKDIEFETLTKVENDLVNQQYLMTFKDKDEAYAAFNKLESLYYVKTINNK